jgi:hypothetical protein
LDALSRIVQPSVPCEIRLPTSPDGQEVDVNRISVRYTPSDTGLETEVPRVQDLPQCDLNNGEGWYFDDPAMPASIIACPSTCAAFRGARVAVFAGCGAYRPLP